MKYAIAITAAMAFLAMAIIGCAAVTAAAGGETRGDDRFEWVTERYFEERVPSGAVRVLEEQAEKASQGQPEAVTGEVQEQVDYEPTFDYYEPQNVPQSVKGNPDGLNSFDGVNYHEGRTETFYSADNAAYRDQLTVDEQGFYRDAEGRYAVAVSEYETNTATGENYKAGDTFQGSQGECVVVDSGCEPGTTDYAVSGW